MKKSQNRYSVDPLLYIQNTVDVPRQELLAVIKSYGISPGKIADYLHQLHDKSGSARSTTQILALYTAH